MRREFALTRARPGFTLVELMIVLTVSVLLALLAVPRFDAGLEAAHVDHATQSLRSIWSAERLYRLEHGTYAGALLDLEAEGLIDGRLSAAAEPFVFRILAADHLGFSASAQRAGSSRWQGTITIDGEGNLAGSITDEEGSVVSPLD